MARKNSYDPTDGDFDAENPASTREAVEYIIALNKQINDFWSHAHGWASAEAADVLAEARLDWQLSMSYLLRQHIRKPIPDAAEAHLIVAWATLGAMVENTMKWFLSVFKADYSNHYQSVKATMSSDCPSEVRFEALKVFFHQQCWLSEERKEWFDYVTLVQQRRNAIHAYKHREIGTRAEFRKAVRTYLHFLYEHHSRVPYPD